MSPTRLPTAPLALGGEVLRVASSPGKPGMVRSEVWGGPETGWAASDVTVGEVLGSGIPISPDKLRRLGFSREEIAAALLGVPVEEVTATLRSATSTPKAAENAGPGDRGVSPSRTRPLASSA